MLNTSNTPNPSFLSRPESGPFHKIGLSFANAGGIVRMTAGHKMVGCLAAWCRTRQNKTDKVFVTTPESLRGAPENLVQVVTLEGTKQMKRCDVFIAPDEPMMNVMSHTSDGGYWAVIYMDRIGQNAEFTCMMYVLDDSWRIDARSATVIPVLSDWFGEDFVETADGMPSAWPVLRAAAVIFGGQDEASLPPVPSTIPESLATAVADEERFRGRQRKARAMSTEDAEKFRASLMPEQLVAFEALLEGKRSF